MVDEWGGIDEGIQDIVSALNAVNITTTGSCEGHTDRSAPAPWVKVTASDKPRDVAHDSKAYRNWQLENKRLCEKTLKLLNEFYSNLDVTPDVRIVIDDTAHAGFWIHNGGDAYDRWRELVAETVAKRQRGEEIRGGISAEENERRLQTLPQYQKEMRAFAKFLKCKHSSSPAR